MGSTRIPISADLVVRNDESRQILMATFTDGYDDTSEYLTLKGILSDYSRQRSIEVLLKIPTKLPESLRMNVAELDDGKREYRLANSDGRQSQSRFIVTEHFDPTGRYLSQHGQFYRHDGKTNDFVLWTDPEPATIIIVGGAVVCLAIIGIDALTTNCEEELRSSIDACISRGGIPKHHTEVTMVVDVFDLEFGCSYHCKFDECLFPSTSKTTTTTITEGGVSKTITETVITPQTLNPIPIKGQIGTSAEKLSKSKCCCCVQNLRIDSNSIRPLNTPDYIGHAFDLVIDMDYQSGSPISDCTLEWWEHVTLTAPNRLPEIRPWQDLFATNPEAGTFRFWRDLERPCSEGGSLTIPCPDSPRLALRDSQGNGRTVRRVTKFRLLVRSGIDCSCEHKSREVTAEQILEIKDGVEVPNTRAFRLL